MSAIRYSECRRAAALKIDEEAAAAVTGEEQEIEAEEEKEIVYPYNEMDIDFDALKASASSSGSAWLSEYFASLIPTRQNEYTGMFEGYNVIFYHCRGIQRIYDRSGTHADAV